MQTMRTPIVLGLVLVALTYSHAAFGQDTLATAEKDARAALAKYFEAWNTGDNAIVRETLNFPFITLGRNGSMSINQTATDYNTNFTQMREREGWHHSTLEKADAVFVGPDRVHFHLVFNRFHPNGEKYMTGHMMYIATKKDGH